MTLFHNEKIHEPKGQENIIYTIVMNREALVKKWQLYFAMFKVYLKQLYFTAKQVTGFNYATDIKNELLPAIERKTPKACAVGNSLSK